MGNGTRVIEGLRQAVAHAKGDATGTREHVVTAPRPALTEAQVRALRETAAYALCHDGRTGGYFRLGGRGRPDFTIRSTTVWKLQRLGLVDSSPVRATEAGRRWLAEHDHAG